MNFNDHTGNWDTDTIPAKDRHTLSSAEALIELHMSANEPQTTNHKPQTINHKLKPIKIRDEYSRDTKIIDIEYKPKSLDDVIKACENLHVEEQHQFKILLQKYEHLFVWLMEN
jgi:hypothetical protein